MVRLAIEKDLDAVEAIYKKILAYDKENGNWTNWKEGVYPIRKTAEKGLENGWLYVGEDEKGIWGTGILNQNQAPEYETGDWLIPAESNEVMVIHTMCMDSDRRHEGKAEEFVTFAEELARSMGCKSMRFDTWEGNLPARTLYLKLGYRLAGGAMCLFADSYMNPLIFLEKGL